jgi:hypothetical protein
MASRKKIAMKIHDSSRRRFVRNSLATSMSISFTGLIRAHGEGGGGDTTTFDPEAPTYSTTYDPEATTYATTYSGETTTWDPETGTTYTTTWDPETGTEQTTEPPTVPWESALAKTDPERLTGKSSEGTPVGTIIAVENKGDQQNPDYQERFTGTVKWVIHFDMNVPPPEKLTNGEAVQKKMECFACLVENVKLSLKVESSDQSLASQIQKSMNEMLGTLFNNDDKKPYMGSPGLVHGVSATAVLDNTQQPVINTDNPAPKASAQIPANLVRFNLVAVVQPPDDNHSKHIDWQCSVPGVTDPIAAQRDALKQAAQAAVREWRNNWQISPGGTFDLPAPVFPTPAESENDWTRQQQGFAGWAQNPADGDTCHFGQ